MEWWLILAFIGMGAVVSYPAGIMVVAFFAACGAIDKYLQRTLFGGDDALFGGDNGDGGSINAHLGFWIIGAVVVFSIGIYGYFRNT